MRAGTTAPPASLAAAPPPRRHPHRTRNLLVVIVAALAIGGGLYFLLGPGEVRLMVHDAPCSLCSHVWVTFTAVSVHESDVRGSGWTDLNTSGATVDLQALNGSAAAQVIGLDMLGAGHYQQVRIEVSKVVVDLTGGQTLVATVEGPSADVNGQFTVAAGGTTTLNIDIDLSASLYLTPGPGGSMSATFTPNVGAVLVSGP